MFKTFFHKNWFQIKIFLRSNSSDNDNFTQIYQKIGWSCSLLCESTFRILGKKENNLFTTTFIIKKKSELEFRSVIIIQLCYTKIETQFIQVRKRLISIGRSTR